MSNKPIKKSKEVIILSGEGDYLGWGWSGLSLDWDRDRASGGAAGISWFACGHWVC